MRAFGHIDLRLGDNSLMNTGVSRRTALCVMAGAMTAFRTSLANARGELTIGSASSSLPFASDNAVADSPAARLAPASKGALVALAKAVAHYERLAAQGWPTVASGPLLSAGDTDARIAQVRRRLLAEQIEPPASTTPPRQRQGSEFFDTALVGQMIRFQRRHGLFADGRIDQATLAAMNVSADERLAMLKTALQQHRELSQILTATRHVIVNVPAYEAMAINNDSIELVSDVIVGRRDTPTPPMSAPARSVSFFPTWTVPPSIVRRSLYTKLIDDPTAFEAQGFEITTAAGKEPISGLQVAQRELGPDQIVLRQKAGPANPLGRIRIDMPNELAIFLHDTPSTQLFRWPERQFSSGCIRVARIVELAAWLLEPTGVSPQKIASVLRGQQAKQIELAASVPVHLVFHHAWAQADGSAHFRDPKS